METIAISRYQVLYVLFLSNLLYTSWELDGNRGMRCRYGISDDEKHVRFKFFTIYESDMNLKFLTWVVQTIIF